MLDLEQAIAAWREQMLAAGIQSPVPLEELESHLREEIERQVEAGRNEPSAFEFAVNKVGQPGSLKNEFNRARGFVDWLGPDTNARVIRILSLFWLVTLAWGFMNTGWIYFTLTYRTNPHFGVNLTQLLIEFILLRGLIGSVRLFRGNARDKRILWLLAILFSVGYLPLFIQTPNFSLIPHSWWIFTNLLINLTSVWFLRPTRKVGLVAK